MKTYLETARKWLAEGPIRGLEELRAGRLTPAGKTASEEESLAALLAEAVAEAGASGGAGPIVNDRDRELAQDLAHALLYASHVLVSAFDPRLVPRRAAETLDHALADVDAVVAACTALRASLGRRGSVNLRDKLPGPEAFALPDGTEVRYVVDGPDFHEEGTGTIEGGVLRRHGH